MCFVFRHSKKTASHALGVIHTVQENLDIFKAFRTSKKERKKLNQKIETEIKM